MSETDCRAALRGLSGVHGGDPEERPLRRLQPAPASGRGDDGAGTPGKVSVTDGPYAETKEQLGGYYVIEAGDLDEAIRIAARIPGAWIGCVEVRPIAEDEPTLSALGLRN